MELADNRTPKDERKFSIVVYGVTGVAGKNAAKHIAKNYGKTINWAIAGRSIERLKDIKN